MRISAWSITCSEIGLSYFPRCFISGSHVTCSVLICSTHVVTNGGNLN